MQRERKAVIQLRVVFALIMREMATRYGRNIGGYVWAVLEPAGTVALLSLIFSYIARRPPLGDSFPVFFATGYMAFHFFSEVSRGVSLAVSANRALLSFPRVTILDTIIARFILHFLTAAFVSVVVLCVAILIYAEPVRIDPAPILLSVALSSLLGLSVGLLNVPLFAFSTTWQTIYGIISRPLFLLSGIFFLFESLPRYAQEVMWWNPLVHVSALMRTGFYPTYHAAFVTPIYVLFFALPFLMLGLLLMQPLKTEILEP